MKFLALLVLAAVVAASAHRDLFRHGGYAPLAAHEARPAPGLWSEVEGVPAIDHTQKFTVTVGLFRRNMEVLRARLDVVSDPTHDEYGNHMTPAQLAAMVSPSAKALQAVGHWFQKIGVKDVAVSSLFDAMTFEASAAEIEHIFQVKFATYSKGSLKVVRALGQVHVPKHLHSIVEIVTGFRAFPIESALKRIKGNADNVDPAVIFATYNVTEFPVPNTNNVQAFFQAQGQYVDPTDLSTFCTKYFPGLKCVVAKYIGKNQPGQPGIESSLDSQYMMGTNKGQVTQWSFSYPNFDFCADLMTWSTDVLNTNASSPRPYVISMSYGWQGLPNMCIGADVTRLNDNVMLISNIGVSVVLASGDDGSGQYSRGGYNKGKLNPSWPASIPYVTAVGSTTFITGNSGAEMAVNEFGSGGGFSFDYNVSSTFTYQAAAVTAYFASGVVMPAATMYPRGGRATPDVSTLGWNFNVVDNGQITLVGGTSASSPTFASMVSMLNNERMKAGKTLGALNPFLYANAAAFNDVLTGTNAISPSKIGWLCTKGWDPATGLGTPNFGKLLDAVKALNARDFARRA